MKFFLKCSETTQVCDKDQYKEASKWENILRRMHLLLCKCCRDYAHSNSRLSDSIKSANLKTFPREQKQSLKSKINKEIKANSRS